MGVKLHTLIALGLEECGPLPPAGRKKKNSPFAAGGILLQSRPPAAPNALLVYAVVKQDRAIHTGKTWIGIHLHNLQTLALAPAFPLGLILGLLLY